MKTASVLNHDDRLNLHLSARQKRDIAEAAKVKDLTISQFVRQALDRAASRILRQRRAA